MRTSAPNPTAAGSLLGRRVLRQAHEWWGILHFGAIALVIALTPSTYQGTRRALIAHNIYTTTWQVLPWFTVLCALICLVLIRIVVVTAQSYGLSQYALEVVVRVLVLELIPLSAALFVVLRTGMAASWQPQQQERAASLTRAQHGLNLVPSVIASGFSVVTLAAVSSVVALLLAYLVVYGFSPWGFAEYTRMVGRVFDGPVGLSFSLKTGLFALAVAVVPAGSNLYAPPRPARGAITVSAGTVRLFLVLVVIEASSLAVKYIG